jgi:hypothetical protein
LWQAQKLLRVTVEYLPTPDGDRRPVRIFASLTTDRDKDDGGYRAVVDIMSRKEWHTQLLNDAFDDMNRFRVKYGHLKELAEVFEAMGRVVR